MLYGGINNIVRLVSRCETGSLVSKDPLQRFVASSTLLGQVGEAALAARAEHLDTDWPLPLADPALHNDGCEHE